MRRFLIAVTLLGLSACSKEAKEAGSDSAYETGPAVSVTAAPGVAFNYRYAFRLPNARIAATQEQHAQACERLGVNRCRITGLRYRLIDKDNVSAMLAFKLDPAIARQFGKDGISVVQKAEGMLVDSEISGTDVGTSIKRADAEAGQLRGDLDRLEAERKRGDLKPADRAAIETRATQLREQLRAADAARTDGQESLATTPMVFDYDAGGLIPGFEGSPIRQSFATAAISFATMLSFIIIALGTLTPWAGLLIITLVIVRTEAAKRLRQALLPGKTADTE